MGAYVREFESTEAEGGSRALALLQSLGLFDRPAEMKCLAALWSLPAIEGLTEPLAGLGEEDRNEVFTEPADPKLLTMNLDAGGEVTSLDAHPLLREFLANALRESRPEAWKAGHKRLYQHLTTMTPEKPAPTLDDLQPLYQAVAHGCLAGLEQDGCGKVYIGRILRGTGSDGFYSSKKLGAFGADLGAVACFFDPPWIRVSPDLTPPYQAWLLNEAGSRLLALGRLTEVLEPMRAGLAGAVVQEDWKNAAVRASNLSELELTLGDVGAAIRDAETAVAHADRGGDEFRRMAHRTTHAEALHQGGMGAEARYIEAESMQVERQPEYPLLTSIGGFRYSDLLLCDAERVAWRRIAGDGTSGTSQTLKEAFGAVAERANKTIKIAIRNNWLLDICLDHLTLARAGLYGAVPSGQKPTATTCKRP
jgi:hypothetical protein